MGSPPDASVVVPLAAASAPAPAPALGTGGGLSKSSRAPAKQSNQSSLKVTGVTNVRFNFIPPQLHSPRGKRYFQGFLKMDNEIVKSKPCV